MPELSAPELHTERLMLRGPTAQDLPALFAINADPEVARYLSRPAWTHPGQADAWLARVETDRRGGQALPLVVTRSSDGMAIGTCALFHLHPESRRAELGYMLGRPHWGHGYMHEALCTLLEHAFGALDLRRLEADIDPRNRASAQVLERLGFCLEGQLRERWEVADEISDAHLYGLLRKEWQQP